VFAPPPLVVVDEPVDPARIIPTDVLHEVLQLFLQTADFAIDVEAAQQGHAEKLTEREGDLPLHGVGFAGEV